MYKYVLRPLLFSLSAERAHTTTFALLQMLFRIPGMQRIFSLFYAQKTPSLAKKVWGITFPNPIGLAAGFDKDAKLLNHWEAFGFGFVEIGTVTPKPQPGNPKPRLFRLISDRAVINRMGFNNSGVYSVLKRLQRKTTAIPVGGNIGKNKITPNEDAVNDYLDAFLKLYNAVDYFVVNVSSPNTPNLRELQEKEPLTRILSTLVEERRKRMIRKPILLKIAPDLTDGQLDDIIDIIKTVKLDGIVATNTTNSREPLPSTPTETVAAIGAGGLSGAPLRVRSTEMVRYLYSHLGPDYPIIAVGGVFTATDALEKLEAGAALVQVYTGFIYEGPAMIKNILNGLKKSGYHA